ncbi:metallophosphoesterase family protein [Paenibacillus sp. y28]|uniref:metallophosphoesterase family protein n=1 Tax=Paenibacillus sp. y28 TaxID=3129110 RepID=UPI003018119D
MLGTDKQQKLSQQTNLCFIDSPGIREFAGVRWGGLGGIIGRPDKPSRMTETEFLRRLRKLAEHEPQGLLMHQSPDVPELGCEGSADIRRTLELGPPGLVFCGHSHWDNPLAELANGTQVLNVDAKVCILTRPLF